MLPEAIADQLLQGQKVVHHIELDGPPFSSGRVSQGEKLWGPAGQRACRVLIVDVCTFLFMRWESNEAKGTPNVSIIKHNNESRQYASNLKTKSFNFKYHI